MPIVHQSSDESSSLEFEIVTHNYYELLLGSALESDT